MNCGPRQALVKFLEIKAEGTSNHLIRQKHHQQYPTYQPISGMQMKDRRPDGQANLLRRGKNGFGGSRGR